MPALSSLMDKFLRRQPLAAQDKTDLLTDLGATAAGLGLLTAADAAAQKASLALAASEIPITPISGITGNSTQAALAEIVPVLTGKQPLNTNLTAYAAAADSAARRALNNAGVATRQSAGAPTPGIDLADAVGQLWRAGSIPPYTWYRAENLTGLWERLPQDAEVVKTSGSQIIAGAKSFSSLVRPTSSGVGPPASNSLTTAEDQIVEQIWSLNRLPTGLFKNPESATNGGSANSAPWGTEIKISAGQASARPIYRRADIETTSQQYIAIQPISTAMIIAIFHSRYYDPAPNLEKIKIRYYVGGNTYSLPKYSNENALSAAGYGFEIYWSVINSRFEIKLFCHGTVAASYMESDGNAGRPAPIPFIYFANSLFLVIGLNAAGLLSLFMSPASTSSISRTPVLTMASNLISGAFPAQNFQNWCVVTELGLTPTNVVSLTLSDTKSILG